METRLHTHLEPGTPPSLTEGAIVRPDGVEFVLFSRNATAVSVLLFDENQSQATDEIFLHPVRNRLGDLWLVFVPGIGPGQLYAYRIDGPHTPERGHRYTPQRVMLDPCAKAINSNCWEVEPSTSPLRGTNFDLPKCVVVNDQFDWQGVGRPQIPLEDSVIYEVHLRGFTASATSRSKHPGTYLGFIEKIPYLKDLGVTTVELLPVQEFDHLELSSADIPIHRRRANYWGYSPYGFFAPNGRYANSRERFAQVTEFKTLVRELHRAGIEVFLDVVFNHTAEGNHRGPVINFKGIDNSIYYFLEEDKRYYRDFSGCGNSINSNHPVVRQMIRNCLRYWVTHMQVDGFRFDLASVLARDLDGNLISNPPLVESIAEDPVLRSTKIIAEAWDAAGAYQVGSFPGSRWAEWNGRFRDDIRRFWRGDGDTIGALATRLAGSSDLYHKSGRKPYHSINFVTCHDGFTLNDLVSYNYKHNIANGEDNRDGENHNNSYNHGVEGPTRKLNIEGTRKRKIKNFLATLLLSQGTPMLLSGDECRRTQLGNNNAYCQDNEISWMDWSLLETHKEIYRFCRELIAFRRRHPALRRREFFQGVRSPGRPIHDLSWIGADGQPKVWENADRLLGLIIDGLAANSGRTEADDDILILINGESRTVPFLLPSAGRPDRPWQVALDTGNVQPYDIFPEDTGPVIRAGNRYPLIENSLACLIRAHDRF